MTATNWDYTELADAYLKRPQYSVEAIDEMLNLAEVRSGGEACDVGAGVAHLALLLAQRGLTVTAVEPNDAMRRNGALRTASLTNVSWYDGTGEATGQPDTHFDIVTFGSSFNVTDRVKALRETHRILKPKGWFACMWNHRNLDDPIQRSIEEVIHTLVPSYFYGSRREDQTQVIQDSGLFGKVRRIEGTVVHSQSLDDCIEAWRSHATLERQSGSAFAKVVTEIEKYLHSLHCAIIDVPYTTRVWVAQSL